MRRNEYFVNLYDHTSWPKQRVPKVISVIAPTKKRAAEKAKAYVVGVMGSTFGVRIGPPKRVSPALRVPRKPTRAAGKKTPKAERSRGL